ncbi:hypothetical protein OKJ48_28040 [Streptomyces kunmingensis]|uniref:Uncharacterized protein n=1 Tax=Streptomyces kunmingensis TaxID=68225 RepID=A0ABU6CH65_9ACTN|nr:hypothetical protein [Streptomyces kunmingensis]MEB3964061.1 hypothetical protein [Streptomyces kunmingensis]
MTALLHATGGNVRPTITTEKSKAGLSSLDEHWRDLFRHIAPQGDEFLIILWGPGSASKGWFRVRDLEFAHTGLPSRVQAAIGRPEFYCISLGNTYFGAVTIEEDEYWIVSRDLS